MNKFKEMQFWIGDDPELSEIVQKALFNAGYIWHKGVKKIQYTSKPYLYAWKDGYISPWKDGSISYGFNGNDFETINIDWMRKRETIQFGDQTFFEDELEASLIEKMEDVMSDVIKNALKDVKAVNNG